MKLFKILISALIVLFCAGGGAILSENAWFLRFITSPNDELFLLIAFAGVIIGGGIGIKVSQLLFWRRRPIFWKSVIILPCVFLFLLCILITLQPYRTCARLALVEYFRPTTVEMMPLPAGCVATSERPSIADMSDLPSEEKFYGLTVQMVSVCKLNHPLPQIEPDFSETVFSPETLRKWLQLYEGCCTYQFRRHFTIVITKSEPDGSLKITMITLIQSRKRYAEFLRWHCDEKLSVFF